MDIITEIRICVTETDSEVEPGGRELQVRAFVGDDNLFGDDNPMLAQLTLGGWGEPIGQLDDDLCNNGDIADEVLARAFGVEIAEGQNEEAFDSHREAIENAVGEAILAAARLHLARNAATAGV
jgi:hypothetical protein